MKKYIKPNTETVTTGAGSQWNSIDDWRLYSEVGPEQGTKNINVWEEEEEYDDDLGFGW
ncbi:MAG: hypothetical protein LUI08_04770 [Prevotella sp.]|nr:hypothetical protein [Prevotella sp.]